MVKTVSLNGAETKVDNLGGYHVSVKNNGSGVLYASASPNIVEGADGVLPIGAGECACCPDCNGTIYLKGSGEVILGGVQSIVNLFASAGGGSSGGGEEVTANPFAVTFGSLDGISADGIWDTANSRIEF